MTDALNLAGHEFTADNLMRRAVRNARPHSRVPVQRWVLVKDIFAVGSTVARAMCVACDLDPNEELRKPR